MFLAPCYGTLEVGRSGRVRAACARLVAPEAAAVDAIAKRRSLDFEQPCGSRFVSTGNGEGPAYEAGLEFPHALVERDRCDSLSRNVVRGAGANVFPWNHDALPRGNGRAMLELSEFSRNTAVWRWRLVRGADYYALAAKNPPAGYFLDEDSVRSSSNFSIRYRIWSRLRPSRAAALVWFQEVRSSAWTTSERSSCSRSRPAGGSST